MAPSIVISGSRTSRAIIVSGATSGFGVGVMATPWIRLDTKSGFVQGRSAVPVAADGAFAWQRRAPKAARIEVYFAIGDARSNTLKW